MTFLRKYWYIVFGNFAFPILAFHTMWVRNKISGLSRSRVNGNLFFLGIVVVGVPTLLTQVIFENSENWFLQSSYALCFYLTGIYATYLHARFREKHGISPKQAEESYNEHSTSDN